MTSQASNRPNVPLQRNRLSVGSVHTSTNAEKGDPVGFEKSEFVDPYNYEDFGPSTTPSKKREEKPKSSTSPKGSHVSGDADDDLPDDLTKRLEIWERETKGRRARPPDKVSDIDEVSKKPDGTASSRASTASKGSKREDWSRRSHSVEPTIPARDANLTRLHRSNTRINNTQSYKLNVSRDTTNSGADMSNSVIWQHSNFEDVRLRELETLVAQLRVYGLRESDIGLTRRLLNRVQLVSEREFVGGRFLTPKAFRYDMLDDSRYGVDKCSIFLNFPYFAVQRPQERERFRKGDERHPVRTLLQSHYRLNETSEKDETQCIRMLDADTLKSCIKDAQPEEISLLTSKPNDELIYVPQMWALIIGLDHLVTVGPFSDQVLHGSAIGLDDEAVSNDSPAKKFVRVSFMNHGMPDGVTYPLDQCTSWFGMLNKHQQIRKALKQGNEKAAPKDYPLRIGHQILDDRSWASVQRSVDGEVLRIWMDTPKPLQVTVTKMDGDSGSEEHSMNESDNESLAGAGSTQSMKYSNFSRLEKVPVVRAFLAWRVVDDFGETDDCPAEVQTRRYLTTIYDSLPATCTDASLHRDPHTSVDRKGPHMGRSARPKLSIQGETRNKVDDLGYDRSIGQKEPSVEQRLWWESQDLFAYFISKRELHQDLAPIRLFWGALYEMMKDHRSYLKDFLLKFKEINARAERLHFGVHIQHTKSVAGRPDSFEDGISESAILLASMVDALGAVFNFIVEAIGFARHERDTRKEQDLRLGKQAVRYCNDACRLLEVAKGQLITEASGGSLGDNLGPIVTPETILIMSMERLVRGVYGTGSIDIINILEECLEQLALRVEKHSSRRLLQKLNAFEEEVDVVNGVLVQQKTVLLTFRESLDPGGFKNGGTTARKMRFQYERRAIEKILTHIQEQLRYCKELRDRAKVLAVQNVQLVETVADDNSRTIFVFTFITVLFLPLSFVAGFFGMNLAGVSDTKSEVSHFWYIAVPLTVGILILCAIFVAWGEFIWFAAADIPRKSKDFFLGKRSKKKKE